MGCLSISSVSAQPDCEFLVWSDEFDTDGLADTNYWGYDVGDGCPWLCGWGNNEQQYYTYRDTANARVKDGVLIIEARNESMGGRDYTSARLITNDLFEITYGRIEISAKLPGGDGVWAALWMLGDQQYYGTWPNNGEVDIMEYVGRYPGEVTGTIHCLTNYGASGDGSSMEVPDAESVFHVYGIDWNPDSISFFVDDSVYHVYNNLGTGWQQWPYDKPFYLIMNIAMGGNLGGTIDDAIFDDPVTMEIDYVRVYQQPENSAVNGPSEVVPGQGDILFTSLIPANKYIWEVPDGAEIISGQDNDSVWVNWSCDSDTLRLTLETDCDTVLIEHIVSTIDIEIKGEDLVHPQETGLVFSIPVLASGTYSWSFPAGTVPVGETDSNIVVVNWGCDTGTVLINYTGVCTEDSVMLPVTIRTPMIEGPTYIAANETGVDFRIDSILSSTYLWTVPENVTITGGQGTTEVTTDWAENGGTVIVEVENGCGTMADSIEVAISNDIVICNFETVIPDWVPFDGGTFEQITNPFMEGINISDNVGQTYKLETAQTWGGIFTDLPYTFNFDFNNTIIMKVYAPKACEILCKLEAPALSVTTQIPFDLTTINEWTTVSYNFNGEPSDTYDRLTLFFDFGNTDQDIYFFDDIIFTYVEPESIAENNIGSRDIIVYPNPSVGTIRIRYSGDLVIQGLNLYDISGKEVFSVSEYIPGDVILPDGLNAGVYILKIKTAGSLHTQKIIIE